ncbi:hypothetical protein DY000_02063639 [Brassica cretica]|uniref:Pectinesterase n=1 Tax=Brassica cretica TaxID=69181 RepID=A0ABQ7AZ74_BRACR|nr:hypothetical protein DY000_02063639 [Brassica cretica]
MPSSAILLNSCHVNGNTEIGEWAAENLLETKPENPGYYMLIANRQLLLMKDAAGYAIYQKQTSDELLQEVG